MKKLSPRQRQLLREKIVEFAKKFVGTPYKYGATGKDAPRYFDCSGFVQYVFRHFGYDLPRSTLLRASYSGRKARNPQISDLIFFRSRRGYHNPKFKNGIGHVVIYTGNGKAVHAVSKVIKEYPVRIEKGWVKIQSLKKIRQLEKEIVVIKRVV